MRFRSGLHVHVNLRRNPVVVDGVNAVQEPMRNTEGKMQDLHFARLNRVRRRAKLIDQLAYRSAPVHFLETNAPFLRRAFFRWLEGAHELSKEITCYPRECAADSHKSNDRAHWCRASNARLKQRRDPASSACAMLEIISRSFSHTAI